MAMSSETVATFFSVVLLASLAAVAVAVLRSDSRSALANSALPFAAAIAVGATAGSLYFSEIADFVPCELCWFQRIAMYPLAVILSIAAFRKDRTIFVYALPLAAAGLAISIYHIQLQAFPDQSSFCAFDNPCTATWVEGLGWMTIPQMAGASFALIIALATIDLLNTRRESP